MMGVVSKGLLLINTVRYLKPKQLVCQIWVRLKKKEVFWEYKKKNVEYHNFNLWIDGLDNEQAFMQRFDVEQLIEGRLLLLNEMRVFDRWHYLDASYLWNFNVHYLEYLIPLYSSWKDTGSDRYRNKINQILNSWHEYGCKEKDSNHAYTISLRIVNQLIIAEVVDDKQKLYDSLYAQYRYLLNNQEKHLLGNHYLENLKAIVICSVIFSENNVYERYIQKLLKELKEEITPDGLHFELSLMYHKIVLEDLIRVALVLEQAKKKEYVSVVKFISRMCTALYSLEQGINRTPLFNDAGDNVAKSKEALLRFCRNQFRIKFNEKKGIAGYHKLYKDKMAIIIDCGNLSPKYMPGHAHCDCLSFELFYDGNPVFVNSGTYQYQGEKRQFFRSTSAHNTVMINDHEQSELWGEHRAARRLSKVQSTIINDEFVGSYKNYLGENHKRKIKVAKRTLEILDQTSGDGVSYLHIAPTFRYVDGEVIGLETKWKIIPINSEVEVRTMLYSDSFGKLEEAECLTFSWKRDKRLHGYRIVLIGENQK